MVSQLGFRSSDQ